MLGFHGFWDRVHWMYLTSSFTSLVKWANLCFGVKNEYKLNQSISLLSSVLAVAFMFAFCQSIKRCCSSEVGHQCKLRWESWLSPRTASRLWRRYRKTRWRQPGQPQTVQELTDALVHAWKRIFRRQLAVSSRGCSGVAGRSYWHMILSFNFHLLENV